MSSAEIRSQGSRSSTRSWKATVLAAMAGTACVCSIVPAARAQGTLYGSDVVSDQLVVINPSTVSGMNIGPLAPMAPSFALTGLAADPATNTIYGISANPPGIWTVNPATGAATLHTSGVFPNNANALAFDPANNRLFVAELNNNALSSFDIATGQATFIATMTGTSNVEGLGYDPATQTLYGLAEGTPETIVKINTTTGAATVIATMTQPGTWRGLDFDQSSGVLYATAVSISQLTRINPATGQVTNLGAVAGIPAFVQGLAWMGEPAPCYPDCNNSGGLTIADFGCFQAKFAASDPYADCNQSGSHTIADFGCFQNKFAAGCP